MQNQIRGRSPEQWRSVEKDRPRGPRLFKGEGKKPDREILTSDDFEVESKVRDQNVFISNPDEVKTYQECLDALNPYNQGNSTMTYAVMAFVRPFDSALGFDRKFVGFGTLQESLRLKEKLEIHFRYSMDILVLVEKQSLVEIPSCSLTQGQALDALYEGLNDICPVYEGQTVSALFRASGGRFQLSEIGKWSGTDWQGARYKLTNFANQKGIEVYFSLDVSPFMG